MLPIKLHPAVDGIDDAFAHHPKGTHGPVERVLMLPHIVAVDAQVAFLRRRVELVDDAVVDGVVAQRAAEGARGGIERVQPPPFVLWDGGRDDPPVEGFFRVADGHRAYCNFFIHSFCQLLSNFCADKGKWGE